MRTCGFTYPQSTFNGTQAVGLLQTQPYHLRTSPEVMGRTIFASQDAWRKHPMISCVVTILSFWAIVTSPRRGCSKGLLPLPGLLAASGIFAVYVILEGMYKLATHETHTGTVYKFEKAVNKAFQDVQQQSLRAGNRRATRASIGYKALKRTYFFSCGYY